MRPLPFFRKNGSWMSFRLGSSLLAAAVAVAVLVAVWLALAAAYENVRFARATDQVLGLVAAARDQAGRDPSFGLRTGEDLLVRLARAGQPLPGTLDGAALRNTWGGQVTATALPASLMRLEMQLPVYNCRRLALFISQDAQDLGVQRMEAQGAGTAWKSFHDAAEGGQADSLSINAACGPASWATLALVFRLR
jgi:hypothetical protein